MKKGTLFVVWLLLHQALWAQVPRVVSGKLQRMENFPSSNVSPRHVDIWLPAGYDGQKKFEVLYMHDGQMLYDSNATWNKQAWEVDDVVTRLNQEKKIRDFIVVGVWNSGPGRHADYFPQKPFESLPRAVQDSLYSSMRGSGTSVFQGRQVNSDGYLKFLVSELKPYIDRNFSVYTDQAHTFIAGSSMGGLISMYAICEYPEVFGGAACLSTHWPGIFTMENNPIPDAFFRYMASTLPDPRTHKIYFDYGTATLDAMYPPLQGKADSVMRTRGFGEGSWMTRSFPGASHSEQAWSDRLDVPLMFLFARR
jgi:predicted alpha/beta superfamily hydrolase